uniref:Ig-like domain-containing protein n=1 Tax=Oryzias latipes TaxID=8090 RepID=A0A3P9I9S6_ORYLA
VGQIVTPVFFLLLFILTLGQKPKLVSRFFRYTKECHLQYSDSATYLCVANFGKDLNFSSAFTVDVKGSGSTIQTSVTQSSSENIHAGDSVTLNCTVHTGSCDEEHRVYWFKDSEDSHPGLIYTHGGRNDQCERKNNTQTHSCVYELPIKNLTESHAGIYYCAVVSCGHILFGNGTKLDLTDSTLFSYHVNLGFPQSSHCDSLLLICFQAENKDTESLHYAAVNVKKSSKTKSQKNDINTDCVYASVRQQN